MKDVSADKLSKLILWVYSKGKLPKILKITSHALVLISILSFGLLIYRSYTVSLTASLKLIIISAVPFILLTLSRRVINAPRPYEVYNIFESMPKDKKGHSFPSRHVFSAFLIATLALWAYPVLGCVLMALALLLSVVRVMLGIHFPRDCIAGGIIGIIAAVIGALVALPFA